MGVPEIWGITAGAGRWSMGVAVIWGRVTTGRVADSVVVDVEKG